MPIRNELLEAELGKQKQKQKQKTLETLYCQILERGRLWPPKLDSLFSQISRIKLSVRPRNLKYLCHPFFITSFIIWRSCWPLPGSSLSTLQQWWGTNLWGRGTICKYTCTNTVHATAEFNYQLGSIISRCFGNWASAHSQNQSINPEVSSQGGCPNSCERQISSLITNGNSAQSKERQGLQRKRLKLYCI